MPKLHSQNFEGMELIRPMYLIKESAIKAWRDTNGLHFIQCACRFTENCVSCGGGRGSRYNTEQCISLPQMKILLLSFFFLISALISTLIIVIQEIVVFSIFMISHNSTKINIPHTVKDIRLNHTACISKLRWDIILMM